MALSWSRVDTSYWDPAPDIGYTLTRSDGTAVEILAEARSQVEYVDRPPRSGTYTYQVAAGVNGGEATRSAILEVVVVVTGGGGGGGRGLATGRRWRWASWRIRRWRSARTRCRWTWRRRSGIRTGMR